MAVLSLYSLILHTYSIHIQHSLHFFSVVTRPHHMDMIYIHTMLPLLGVVSISLYHTLTIVRHTQITLSLPSISQQVNSQGGHQRLEHRVSARVLNQISPLAYFLLSLPLPLHQLPVSMIHSHMRSLLMLLLQAEGVKPLDALKQIHALSIMHLSKPATLPKR